MCKVYYLRYKWKGFDVTDPVLGDGVESAIRTLKFAADQHGKEIEYIECVDIKDIKDTEGGFMY